MVSKSSEPGPSLEVGATVEHGEHGPGRVVQLVRGGRAAMVRFERLGKLDIHVGAHEVKVVAAPPRARATSLAMPVDTAPRLDAAALQLLEALRLGTVPGAGLDLYTVGRERELAAIDADIIGNHVTAEIDHIVHHALGGTRAHQNHAAGRIDRAAADDGGVGVGGCLIKRLGHLELDQPIAREIDRHRLAGPERNTARSRCNHAFIADRRRRQGGITTGRDVDGAGIDDRCVLADLIDRGTAGAQEFCRIHAPRGRQQPTDIDLAARPDHHAIGVRQPNLARSRNISIDPADVRARDPVQGDRGTAGLVESNALP